MKNTYKKHSVLNRWAERHPLVSLILIMSAMAVLIFVFLTMVDSGAMHNTSMSGNMWALIKEWL